MKVLPNDSQYRTQEQAIAHHNQRKERMMSMPDVFKLVQEGNIETIESLRSDFDKHWVVTSTRIIYASQDLSAKIIHNAGSTVVKEKEIRLKEIPDYSSEKLTDVLNTKEGLAYIRALIDKPKATREQITTFFTSLSGKRTDKIRFWTPSQSSRANKQVRAVVLYFGYFRFCVVGNDWFDYDCGLSRGVIIDSAKQSKFFSNKAVFDIEAKTITIPMQKTMLKKIEKSQKRKTKVKIIWKLKVDVK